MTVPTLGHHVLLELFSCEGVACDDLEGVRAALHGAAQAMGTPVLGESYHRFTPQGVSGVILIAESHISCHSWPEEGYVAVDIYTCGAVHPREAIAALCASFRAGRWLVQSVIRGFVAYAPEGRVQRDQLLIVPEALGRPLSLASKGEQARLLHVAGVANVTAVVPSEERVALQAALEELTGEPLGEGVTRPIGQESVQWRRQEVPWAVLSIDHGRGELLCTDTDPFGVSAGTSRGETLVRYPLFDGQRYLIRTDKLWHRIEAAEGRNISGQWMSFPT